MVNPAIELNVPSRGRHWSDAGAREIVILRRATAAEHLRVAPVRPHALGQGLTADQINAIRDWRQGPSSETSARCSSDELRHRPAQ
jgi:hypothetical protein